MEVHALNTQVLIIGGGFASLAAAIEPSKYSKDVTVVLNNQGFDIVGYPIVSNE